MILILAGGKSTDPSVHAIASHLIGTRVPPPLDPSNGKNGNENLLRVANKSCSKSLQKLTALIHIYLSFLHPCLVLSFITIPLNVHSDSFAPMHLA